MKWAGPLYLALVIALLSWIAIEQSDRITELECALAQAQALLAEESLSTGNLVLDGP